MDPKLRDELEKLQQSEAHSAWQWFKGWWDRHGTKVLFVLLALAFVFALKSCLDRRALRQQEEKYAALDQATSPETAAQAAEEHSDDPMFQARAYLKAGDLALGRATLPSGNLPNQVSPEVHESMLQSAEANYKKVLALADIAPVYQLNARLGLASCAEDRRQWDQARQAYGDVAAAADKANLPLIALQAKALATRMNATTQPVILDTSAPAINVQMPKSPTTQGAPPAMATTQPGVAPVAPATQPAR
jgi:hypothetical protein